MGAGACGRLALGHANRPHARNEPPYTDGVCHLCDPVDVLVSLRHLLHDGRPVARPYVDALGGQLLEDLVDVLVLLALDLLIHLPAPWGAVYQLFTPSGTPASM